MLGSDDQPVRSILVEAGEFEKLEKDPHAKVLTIGRNDTQRGVPHGDGFLVIDKNAQEAIGAAERSTVVEPDSLVPTDQVPFDLADKSLAVVPDKKVAGAATSVDALFSYLADTDQAYVTEVTLRAGSRDSILVLYPAKGENALLAITLPFGEELNENPDGYERTYNEAAGDVLASAGEGLAGDFSFDNHESKYLTRRNDAIDKLAKGQTPVKAKSKAPSMTGVDLLTAVEQGIGAAPAAKKSRAKSTRGGTKKRASKAKAKA
jgi:non-homologous end joining protein Ku